MNIQKELEKIRIEQASHDDNLEFSCLRKDHEKQRREILALKEQINILQKKRVADKNIIAKYNKDIITLNLECERLKQEFNTYKDNVPYKKIIKEVKVPVIEYVDNIKIETEVIEIPRKKFKYLYDVVESLKWVITLLFVSYLIFLNIPSHLTHQLDNFAYERNKRLKTYEQNSILKKEQQSYKSDLKKWQNRVDKLNAKIEEDEKKIKAYPDPLGWGGKYTTRQQQVRNDLENNKDALADLQGSMPDIRTYDLK